MVPSGRLPVSVRWPSEAGASQGAEGHCRGRGARPGPGLAPGPRGAMRVAHQQWHRDREHPPGGADPRRRGESQSPPKGVGCDEGEWPDADLR